MGKVVFIGDIHGRDTWKTIVEREQDADRIVFIGDYLDTKGERITGKRQVENLHDIMEFKQAKEDKVVLLFGNHDYHYLPEFCKREYSGFQPGIAPKVKPLFRKNMDLFDMAFAADHILCSHAGVSSEWLNDFAGPEGELWHAVDLQSIVSAVNKVFREQPKVFEVRSYNPMRDSPWESPIWIRPAGLLKNNPSFLKGKAVQVFGHTMVEDMRQAFERSIREWQGRYFMADGLAQGSYLVYGDGQLRVETIVDNEQ